MGHDNSQADLERDISDRIRRVIGEIEALTKERARECAGPARLKLIAVHARKQLQRRARIARS